MVCNESGWSTAEQSFSADGRQKSQVRPTEKLQGTRATHGLYPVTGAIPDRGKLNYLKDRFGPRGLRLLWTSDGPRQKRGRVGGGEIKARALKPRTPKVIKGTGRRRGEKSTKRVRLVRARGNVNKGLRGECKAGEKKISGPETIRIKVWRSNLKLQPASSTRSHTTLPMLGPRTAAL